MRLILLAVLVLVGLLVWKALTRRGRPSDTRSTDEGRMVRCDHCGIYLPESEACRDGERFFCSDEHRRHRG